MATPVGRPVSPTFTPPSPTNASSARVATVDSTAHAPSSPQHTQESFGAVGQNVIGKSSDTVSPSHAGQQVKQGIDQADGAQMADQAQGMMESPVVQSEFGVSASSPGLAASRPAVVAVQESGVQKPDAGSICETFGIPRAHAENLIADVSKRLAEGGVSAAQHLIANDIPPGLRPAANAILAQMQSAQPVSVQASASSAAVLRRPVCDRAGFRPSPDLVAWFDKIRPKVEAGTLDDADRGNLAKNNRKMAQEVLAYYCEQSGPIVIDKAMPSAQACAAPQSIPALKAIMETTPLFPRQDAHAFSLEIGDPTKVINVDQNQCVVSKGEADVPKMLFTVGVGPCVALSLHDSASKTFALAHFDSPLSAPNSTILSPDTVFAEIDRVENIVGKILQTVQVTKGADSLALVLADIRGGQKDVDSQLLRAVTANMLTANGVTPKIIAAVMDQQAQSVILSAKAGKTVSIMM